MQRFFLNLLCFVLVLSSSSIGATVPSQYIVYAVDTCKIGDRAGTTGSGLIGSAKLVSIGSDAVINGDIYSAGTINLFDRAIVNGSVTAKNSINKSFGVVVNGTTNPNTNVVSYTIPTKSFTTGTTNVFVPLDSTKVIAPGNYGDITISARSTVTFSNGIYNVKSLIIDNDVKVKLDFPSDGKIEFNSSGTLTIGDRVVTTFLHNNKSYAVNYYSAGTATVRVGFDGTAYGNIVAPNALAIIHRGTQFTGTVYAKKIELQPSVFYEADVVAPNLRITYPVNGTYSSSRTPRVVVKYIDDKAGLDISTLRVYINGADRTSLFILNGDSAVWQIPSNYKLPEGQNTIAADVKDRSANLTHAEVVFKVDESKPVTAFVSPVNGTSSPIDTPLVSVSFSDQYSGINKSGFIALLDGSNVTSQFTLTNTTAIYQMRPANKLSSGTHTFTASILDSCGNVQSASSSYTVNKPPVTVAIIAPANGSYTNQNPVSVHWSVNGVEQTTQTSQILVQGNNVITRSFTDQYGTTGTASVNITLDTQAPVVAISSPTDNSITNQSTATVAWTVDGIAQTTQTTATLTEGVNTITRSVTDAAGNTGTASVNVTLDTQAPVVAINSPLDNTVTNQSTETVAWTVDGATQTTQTTASLTEGANTITRSFTDAAGNTGTASVNVTLDTQAPVVAISSPLDNTVTNQSATTVAWTVDGVSQTTQTTATLTEGVNTITRSVTDAAGNTGTASVNVTLDTHAPVVAISSPTDNSLTNQSTATVAWTVDGLNQTTQTTASLTEGTNTITRSITDAAGNIGTASVNVTLDTQAPVIAITTPINNSLTNQIIETVAWTVDGVAQTTQTTVALTEGANIITRSVTDAAGNTGTASVSVTLDSQAPVIAISSPVNNSITNQSTATVTWTVDGVPQTTQTTASLTEGANTITRSVTDAAGNTGTASVNVTLDAQAPVVAISSPADNSVTNQNAATVVWTVDGIAQTTQTTVSLTEGANTITRSVTDAAGNTGTASVNVKLDTQAPVVAINSPLDNIVTNQSTATVAWTVDGVNQTTQTTTSLTEGANTITRSFTDAAGNIGTASVNVTLDTQAPVVAISSPIDNSLTNQSTATVAWTVDGVAQTTQTTASLTEGANRITRSATDAAGNTDTASVNVTLDTQAPVVAISSPVNNSITNQRNAIVAWTVDGVAQTTQTTASLTEGSNTITRSVTDAAGNTGTASVIVQCTLIPNNAPKITSTPVVSVARNVPYTYDVNAVDQDGDVIKYSLKESPSGMEINSNTGVITWNPENVTKSDIDTGLGLQWIKVRDDLVASSLSYLTMFHAAYNSKENKVLVFQDTISMVNKFPIGYLLTPDTIEPFSINGINNRLNTMLTYDANSGCYVVYGGWCKPDNYLGDTWIYQDGIWTQKNVSGPGNRSNGMLFYNGSTQQVYLFGGSYYQTIYGDTWEWDGQNWKNLAVSGPSPRMWANTAYIESEGKTILFGGSSRYWNNYLNDTWLWDGHSWELAATTGPSPRENGLMAYDPQTESVILVGGFSKDSAYFSSTWEWKNSQWKQIDIPTPAVRRGLLWFDKESEKLYLYGRSINDSYTSGELWVLDYLPKYGKLPLTVQAEDARGAYDEQKYNIGITGNNVPQIYSLPKVVCKPDSQYTYNITANDFDGDPLDYTLLTAPSGMTIDAENGSILWIPDSTQIGSHRVTLIVADAYGGIDAQSFRLIVSKPPVISSTPVTEVIVGDVYKYQVVVSDNEPISVQFVYNPVGMSIDSNFLITWSPQQNDVGNSKVILRAVDKYGVYSEQSFNITVGINTPPQIVSNPETVAQEGNPYLYTINATDADMDKLAYSLLHGPEGMTIDSTGNIKWTPSATQAGIYTVELQVIDNHGGMANQQFTLNVENTINLPPAFTSVPPAEAFQYCSYSYQISVRDSDNDSVIIGLLSAPPGMTINESGELTWIPQNIGNFNVSIIARDPLNASDTQTYEIRVNPDTTSPPHFTSTPIVSAIQGQPYLYTAAASDPDRDILTFSKIVGPADMTVSSSGVVAWVPQNEHVGDNTISISVSDGRHIIFQNFVLNVTNVNDTPVITSNAITLLTENSNYYYKIIATDADNDPLSYQLISAPAGMTITSSGSITWSQKPSVGTTALVLVRVTDPSGTSAEQSWTISVIDDNVPPSLSIFTNPPVAKPGDEVVIAVESSDDAGVESLSLTIDGTPVSMINNEYVYHCAIEGFVVLAATAVDSNGNSTTTEKQLIISNTTDNTPPTLSMSVGSSSLIVDQPVTVTVTANDDISLDTERVWLFVNNNKTPLVNGTAQFTPSKQGNYAVRAVAYDMAGNYKDTLVTLFAAYNGMDVTPPVAELVTPDDTTLYIKTEITGTASDNNFAYYTLRYLLNDTRDTVEFFRSGSPVVNGTLGTLDPSTMENGAYQLLLTVYDKAGNGLVDKTYITVDGQLKTGIFTLAFEDLSFQLPGVNCQAVRTYDSRNKAKSDFGFGWTLDIHSVKLTESCKPGDFWSIRETKHGPSMPSTYSLDATRNHTIHIAMPGGRTQSFKPEARFFGQYDPTYGEIVYTPDAGTYSKLEALDVGNFYVMGGVLYDESGNYDEPYNPQQYKLTLLDGTSYIIDQNLGGVTRIEDLDNNRISITTAGITHSAGQSIIFTRDLLNRISQINDNTGRVLQYFYDGLGNLSKVIDPAGAITRFKYNQDHYLQEIIDPRGVRAARVEYDTDGRMIRQINPAGDTVLFTHDMDNNREVVSDFRGNETEYTYDSRGNVLTKTDAAGNEWEYTYDQHDNVIGTVDPNNHQKSSTFDARGNELTSTDELNRTVTRTYTASGQIATEVDALNRTSRYDYDTRGNLLTVTGPDNTVTGTKTYDAFGNVLTEKDALGFLTKYTYDNQGRMVSKTDPAGRTSRFVLDSRGNTIMEINPSGDTTRSVYDIKGNLIMSISPTGDSSRSEYNVFGKVARQIDVKGNATVFEYDIFGQLKRTIAPDSTLTEKEYDADGNAIASIDETGRKTEFEYDFEKRVTRTIAPDRSATRTVYDKLGRRTASIDAKGIRTEYEYDAVGNNTIVRDPYGTQTTYVYDNANRKVEMIDALSQHTSYAYDEYDRLVRTTFDDNTYTETSYDANGRKTAERDQQGKVTQFAYDSLGNLETVTDAMNHVTRYTYDSNNNRISQTDANNHATTMEYDRYNRMTKRTYPGNGQERFGYDISGAMLYRVSGNDSTVYSYDNRNREVLRTFTSGHSVRTTYTPDGKRDSVIDYRGVTTYAYDSLTGQLTRIINPDSSWIEYAYDINKNRVLTITPWDETHYTYDSLNRMKLVIQGDDTTQYFYNSVGNRDSVANANGTSTAYRYDRLNRLLSVINYDAANAVQTSYTYSLNNAGMRTQVSEHDGSVVAYTYDDSYKLTTETRSGTHPYTINYTYDNVGNRLTQVKDGVATTYTYNNRDQLLDEVSTAEQIHYTYDNSGRMATKTSNSGTTVYSWIDDDRLETIVSPNDTISYAYDADNMRVASVASNGDKLYLIDKSLPYGQVIAEYDSTGSLKCGYVYGLERISQRSNGGVHYYVADGQGSIRALTDTAGTITDTYFYTAFGEELAKTGTTENEFRYVGEQWDPNAGFYYLRARWYDQSTGRFASVDPYAGDPQAPVSLHRYLYANASPVYYTDPSGKISPQMYAALALISTLTLRVAPRAEAIVQWANRIVPNSVALGQNLVLAGAAKIGQAHHIVAGLSQYCYNARNILLKYQVEINAAANGVYIPLQRHVWTFNTTYYKLVDKIVSSATSNADVLSRLDKIRSAILSANSQKELFDLLSKL